jgi:predicted lactoylglutathione lyase
MPKPQPALPASGVPGYSEGMEQRISLITLGVRDLERSVRFYEALGWERSVRAAEGVAFFQCGGLVLSLYPVEDLAADAGLASGGSGFAGFALAQNVRAKAEVDQLLAEAEAVGGRIVKPGADIHWGGYIGYFSDPDGHLWEIAWNPGFPLDAAGMIELPD